MQEDTPWYGYLCLPPKASLWIANDCMHSSSVYDKSLRTLHLLVLQLVANSTRNLRAHAKQGIALQ